MFKTLHEFALDVHGRTRTSDLRADAARAAIEMYPQMSTLPVIVNVCALALSFAERVEWSELRKSAIDFVHDTDLRAFPGQPPRLLRGPVILESNWERGEYLFGNIVSLGAYPLDGAIYLVGLSYPDGIHVERWAPTWDEHDIDDAVQVAPSLFVADSQMQRDFVLNAARFLLVLGLLQEAESTPLDVTRAEFGPRTKREADRTRQKSYAVTSVYLPQRKSVVSGGGEGDADLSGKLERETAVTGHLKRQRHGPGLSDIKWIYVQEYAARRWVSPLHRKKIVRH